MVTGKLAVGGAVASGASRDGGEGLTDLEGSSAVHMSAQKGACHRTETDGL